MASRLHRARARGGGGAGLVSAPSTQLSQPSNALAQEQLGAAPAVGTETPLLDSLTAPAPLHEVRETVAETISDAPTGYTAWNGSFGWESKFALRVDRAAHTVTIVSRLQTSADEATRQGWEQACEAKWGGGRRSLVVAPAEAGGAEQRYGIHCDLQWVTAMENPHYVVTANGTGATASGRAGLGGTTSMTAWGTADRVDVAHEFGHMLGAVEDYFTTNGEDHTSGGTRRGFRDPNGGIMNNPSDDPFPDHYELVRRHGAAALGVPEARCSVA